MKIQQYAASEQGYFVLGIQYVNGKTVGSICKGKPSNCEYDTRVEIITGQDVSPYISVSPANSILNRLISLLNYLSINVDPVWGSFFASTYSLNWSIITIAGHSQG
jgi:hypothetical protein